MPKKLISHHNVFINNQNNNEACLIVSCGTLTKPRDNNDVPLTEPSEAFEKYLIDNVIPNIAAALDETVYTISSHQLDYPNGSFLPALLFKRTDNTVLTENDIANLQVLIHQSIDKANKPLIRKMSSSQLFHHSTPVIFVPNETLPAKAADDATPSLSNATHTPVAKVEHVMPSPANAEHAPTRKSERLISRRM